jgi:hypothetical protein
MKDREGMRISSTRRRFLFGAPVGLFALSACAVRGASQAKGAPGQSHDLPELTATEAVSLLRTGDLSAEKYAQALLDQCRTD